MDVKPQDLPKTNSETGKAQSGDAIPKPDLHSRKMFGIFRKSTGAAISAKKTSSPDAAESVSPAPAADIDAAEGILRSAGNSSDAKQTADIGEAGDVLRSANHSAGANSVSADKTPDATRLSEENPAAKRQMSGNFAQPSGAFAQPSGAFAQPSGLFSQPLGNFACPGSAAPCGGDVASFADLGVGKEISQDYRVGNEIGRGGCAVVCEAWRLIDDMHVVIKVLHSNIPLAEEEARVAIKRFIREAEVISSLHEAHIVRCVDYGCYCGTPCMVLEFVDGLPLDKLLQQMGTLPLAYATGIIEQLLCALEETHSKEIIHRDIKPSNIMVFDSPPPYEIRVLDFGIASVYDNLQQSQTLMTQQGSVRGTPSYMAPELFTGESKASREADIYAAGLVYYEMLTGKIAFNGENFMRIAYKQVNTPLELPGSVPPQIAGIIYKMCAKSAKDRYHSAREVLSDIRANISKALACEEKCVRQWTKDLKERLKRGDLSTDEFNSLSALELQDKAYKSRRLLLRLLAVAGSAIGGILIVVFILSVVAKDMRQPAEESMQEDKEWSEAAAAAAEQERGGNAPIRDIGAETMPGDAPDPPAGGENIPQNAAENAGGENAETAQSPEPDGAQTAAGGDDARQDIESAENETQPDAENETQPDAADGAETPAKADGANARKTDAGNGAKAEPPKKSAKKSTKSKSGNGKSKKNDGNSRQPVDVDIALPF